MSDARINKTPLISLTVFVCIAGAVVGCIFGSIMSFPGTLLGGIGGLLASILWSWIMIRKVMRGSEKLVGSGGLWGMVAGILATVVLHGGYALVSGTGNSDMEGIYGLAISVGLVLGTGAGLFTGLVCGGLCKWAASAAWAKSEYEAAE